MLTALYTALAIAAMLMIIPLMVWGGTGSWRHALHALKEYLIAMGVIVGIGLLFAIPSIISTLFNR